MRIAAFPYHDWRKGEIEGMRWRDGHLLETFANHPDVDGLLVVDRPVSWSEHLLRRTPWSVRGRQLASRRSGTARGVLTEVAPAVAVLDVAVADVLAPIRRKYAWWFDVFGRRDVLDLVGWASAEFLGPNPAAIAWLPTVAPAVDRIAPGKLVFDSLDNWLLHPQLRKYADLAAAGYAQLLPKADAVIVSAPRSRDALARWADGIEIVPNGVSPQQFAGLTERPRDLPVAPVVGYAGSLGPRVDARLVVETAGKLPGATFVFIGQALDRATQAAISRAPNVRVLGDRHYSTLPSYLRAFDVAWIPHAIGSGESGGDPIKMYEYWAAGREVVATPIDGLDKWHDRLHIVENAAEAAETITGLFSGSIAPKEATVPEDRTWEAIAERFVAHLRGKP